MRAIITAAILSASALPASAAQNGAPTAAETVVLAGPCVTCHGPDGAGAGGIPAIKGRPAPVLLDKLTAFKQGSEPSTIMGRLAKGYSDEQLERLARHFGAQ